MKNETMSDNDSSCELNADILKDKKFYPERKNDGQVVRRTNMRTETLHKAELNDGTNLNTEWHFIIIIWQVYFHIH